MLYYVNCTVLQSGMCTSHHSSCPAPSFSFLKGSRSQCERAGPNPQQATPVLPQGYRNRNERGVRAGSEFPQSLSKRLRVPLLPTHRVVVETLGRTPTDSYIVPMDQRRLHLQAEVCFSSPLVPCSLPFLFSRGHGRCVRVPAPILNKPRRFYPILLCGSTSSDLVTQARPPGNGGISRTTAEDT